MNDSRSAGLGVAVAALAILVLMPALIVVLFYAFANVYAMITGSDFSSDTINVGVFLTGLVLTVVTIAILMAVAVGLIGRGLSPRRRREDRAFDTLDEIPDR